MQRTLRERNHEWTFPEQGEMFRLTSSIFLFCSLKLLSSVCKHSCCWTHWIILSWHSWLIHVPTKDFENPSSLRGFQPSKQTPMCLHRALCLLQVPSQSLQTGQAEESHRPVVSAFFFVVEKSLRIHMWVVCCCSMSGSRPRKSVCRAPISSCLLSLCPTILVGIRARHISDFPCCFRREGNLCCRFCCWALCITWDLALTQRRQG